MKCCWCLVDTNLIEGKKFCNECNNKGKECRHCHRPMPERFFAYHPNRCNACYNKSENQKQKRR